MSLFKKCPTCGHDNAYPGPVDCVKCQSSLTGVAHAPLSTDQQATPKGASGARAEGKPARRFCDCSSPKANIAGYCEECDRKISGQSASPLSSATAGIVDIKIEGRQNAFTCALPCVIGRESGSLPDAFRAVLQTEFPGVSERHCVLLRQSGQLILIDLGSTNGTHVADQKTWNQAKPDVATTISDSVNLRLGMKCVLSLSWRSS